MRVKEENSPQNSNSSPIDETLLLEEFEQVYFPLILEKTSKYLVYEASKVIDKELKSEVAERVSQMVLERM